MRGGLRNQRFESFHPPIHPRNNWKSDFYRKTKAKLIFYMISWENALPSEKMPPSPSPQKWFSPQIAPIISSHFLTFWPGILKNTTILLAKKAQFEKHWIFGHCLLQIELRTERYARVWKFYNIKNTLRLSATKVKIVLHNIEAIWVNTWFFGVKTH